MRLLTLVLAAGALSLGSAQAQDQATASMIDGDEASVGRVTFNATPSGVTHIVVEMTDLPPGPHGFHVHETGECDPADEFKSAGGHLAGGKAHGIEDPEGPHPGDLPNVNVGQDGILKVEFFAEDLPLEEGENSLRDQDGSAVVLHAEADDYRSQPSGEAGDRIACGVIE
ncbi:superoxide dismutase family protein [Nitratireductor luteus]|uniref:superoxide dismutase family protein n=1 Tax=Nitratireductor luteus TaxID=2976980 RepID=UPI0022403AEE|nr:superoxide dismutase family protein [Nitratireductor luteus]